MGKGTSIEAQSSSYIQGITWRERASLERQRGPSVALLGMHVNSVLYLVGWPCRARPGAPHKSTRDEGQRNTQRFRRESQSKMLNKSPNLLNGQEARRVKACFKGCDGTHLMSSNSSAYGVSA